MLESEQFALTDLNEQRLLVDAYPWARLVSVADSGLIVSHLPVVRDPAPDGLAVLRHLARADCDLHQLGKHDVVVILQGPHG